MAPFQLWATEPHRLLRPTFLRPGVGTAASSVVEGWVRSYWRSAIEKLRANWPRRQLLRTPPLVPLNRPPARSATIAVECWVQHGKPARCSATAQQCGKKIRNFGYNSYVNSASRDGRRYKLIVCHGTFVGLRPVV